MSPGSTPQARKARNDFWTAVWQGRVERAEVCEQCGTEEGSFDKLQAHHDDYAKPLAVRWFCRSCHARHHLAERRAAGMIKPKPRRASTRSSAKFDPLIIEVAAMHKVPAGTIRKWRVRGVPHKFRSWISFEAERRGIARPQFLLDRPAKPTPSKRSRRTG